MVALDGVADCFDVDGNAGSLVLVLPGCNLAVDHIQETVSGDGVEKPTRSSLAAWTLSCGMDTWPGWWDKRCCNMVSCARLVLRKSWPGREWK